MNSTKKRDAVNLYNSRLIMGEKSKSNAWVTPIVALLKKNNINHYFLGKECRAELVDFNEQIFVSPGYEVSQVLSPENSYFIRSGLGVLPTFFANKKEIYRNQLITYDGGVRLVEKLSYLEEFDFDKVLENLQSGCPSSLIIEAIYEENDNCYSIVTSADYINYPIKGDSVYLQPILGQVVVEEKGLPKIAYFSSLIKKVSGTWKIVNSELITRNMVNSIPVRKTSRKKLAYYIQRVLSIFSFNIFKVSDFTNIKKIYVKDIKFFRYTDSDL